MQSLSDIRSLRNSTQSQLVLAFQVRKLVPRLLLDSAGTTVTLLQRESACILKAELSLESQLVLL